MKKNTTALKWLYQQSKLFIGYIIILTLLGMFLSFCSVAFALASKNVIDAATGEAASGMARAIVNLAVLVVLQLILQILFSKINIIATGRLNMFLQRQIFDSLLDKDYTKISQYHSAELINRINADVRVVTNGIIGIIPDGLSLFVRILLSFWALFMLEPLFALICLVVGSIALPISRIYRDKIKTLYRKCQESDGKVRAFMQECIQNILVIKSFGNNKNIIGHSSDLQNQNYCLNIKRNNISIAANILFYLAVIMGFYFALAWGAYKLSLGLISFGTLTAMLQLVGQIQVPFKNISSIMPQYFAVIAASERITEIIDLPKEPYINKTDFDCNALYEDLDSIVFEKVCFAYDKTDILLNTDLTVKKGDFILISGSSGIGKSTFLKLLLGIIQPTSGRIYLKLKTGNEIVLDKKIRKLFSYVPQGNMILSGTIRENICFLSNTCSEDEIIQSAKAAQIWDFIESLPDKLDTVLGEMGIGLSEGQVQRIAVARALCHDTPILLLDEATSALDEQTEAKMLQSINSLSNKTCIVVSHKKAAFEICRRSASIEKGKFKLLDI